MKDALHNTKVEKNEVLLLPHEGVLITLLLHYRCVGHYEYGHV